MEIFLLPEIPHSQKSVTWPVLMFSFLNSLSQTVRPAPHTAVYKSIHSAKKKYRIQAAAATAATEYEKITRTPDAIPADGPQTPLRTDGRP